MPRKMSPDNEKEYNELSLFIEYYCTNVEQIDRGNETHPSNVQDEIVERYGKSKALQGLRQAINDTIEKTIDLDTETVKNLDAKLSSNGVVTMSELRKRYSSKYRKVVARGSIKNETEYYLVNSLLCDQSSDLTNIEREQLSSMVAEFDKNA